MTDLSDALRDLAATVPDDPARLACVHRRAAHAHRRRRAVGAGALAATMAATVAGAEVLVSSGHRAAAPVPAASSAPPAASPAALPACPDQPAVKPIKDPVTAAIGQQFTGGGIITAKPTATSIALSVVGGPLGNTAITLTVTSDSKVFQATPAPNVADQVTTSDQLQAGETAKFTATRTGATSYVLDELHAAPVTDPGSASGTKAASGLQAPTPAAIGGQFKAGGVAVSWSANSVRVNVTRGNLAGIVTFTLQCTPAHALAGDEVEISGTRTGPTTYVANTINVQAAPLSP